MGMGLSKMRKGQDNSPTHRFTDYAFQISKRKKKIEKVVDEFGKQIGGSSHQFSIKKKKIKLLI